MKYSNKQTLLPAFLKYDASNKFKLMTYFPKTIILAQFTCICCLSVVLGSILDLSDLHLNNLHFT